MDDLAEFFQAMADRLDFDYDELPPDLRAAASQLEDFYRAKARNLRVVTNARALSDGVMKLGGGT
jgi:hypothetical protein